MHRRSFLAALVGVVAAPLAGSGQTVATKTIRIGYISSLSAASGQIGRDGFRQGLRDLGYVEGRNIVIEYRWADGNYDRLPNLAKELVSLNPDVILSTGGPLTARAVRAVTTIVPVVFISSAVVESGLVSSLARPGGSLTGIELYTTQLDSKRLQLLKEMLPRATRTAVLWNSAEDEGQAQRRGLGMAAQEVGVKVRFVEARHPDELQAAFATVAQERPDALLISADPMFASEARRIARWTAETRLPAMSFRRSFVDAGGLMSYGPDFAAIARHAAIYVDKVLKGAKPGDLPVEQPTRFELVINMKTAKALGLTIPPSLLLRADQVIQ